jgi:L-alanine-DL-glutamate epimerase-like enolase superfamily enzyme
VRITSTEAIVLRLPDASLQSANTSGEAAVLRIHTDEGLVGVAECNHSPEAIRALLHAKGASSWSIGVEAALVGRDPLDLELVTSDLYRGNAVSARRGLGLGLLNAIDVALWDIRAQARGEPLWKTVWGDRAASPSSYATVYTGPGTFDATVARLGEMVEGARRLGYDAVKIEPLEDCVPEELIEEFLGGARTALGAEARLLVDFGHRFPNAEAAVAVIERIAPSRPTLVETPLWLDDLSEYARLVASSPVPIAASELLESPWEFQMLMEVGRVDIVQPWLNRVGISGTLAVVEMAAARGRRTILAGWHATPIGVAASVHIAAGLGPDLALEHAPNEIYNFPFRRIGEELPITSGAFTLPERAGLGIELDEEALAFYGQ